MSPNLNKYSILMSVYAKNTTGELKQCIDSMLGQTIMPEQFIIVCDGPVSNEINDLLSNYAERNPDIFSILRLEKNQGLAVALNEGLKISRNELVARMDSDDISLPERCEKQLNKFCEDTQLALLGTGTFDFIENLSDAKLSVNPYPTDHESIKKTLRRNNPFAHSTIMFKKSVVDECGGYDPELRRRQDYDLFSKMVSAGYKAGNLEEPLLYFRSNNNFMERNKNKETCDARIAVQKRIYSRGECSFFDYFYVWLAMKVSMITPVPIYKFLYKVIKKNTK